MIFFLGKYGRGRVLCLMIRALRMWREKFDEDPDWYPGKTSEEAETPGRKKVITKAQENAIARSAM